MEEKQSGRGAGDDSPTLRGTRAEGGDDVVVADRPAFDDARRHVERDLAAPRVPRGVVALAAPAGDEGLELLAPLPLEVPLRLLPLQELPHARLLVRHRGGGWSWAGRFTTVLYAPSWRGYSNGCINSIKPKKPHAVCVVLVPWAHSPIWSRQDPIFVSLTQIASYKR